MCYLKPPLGYLIYLHINDYLHIMPPRGLMVVMVVVVMANLAVDASVALNFYY